MRESPKKSIAKRPWFWPVVGLCVVGAIAGGGEEKDQENPNVESEKSIVQTDTTNRPTAPNTSDILEPNVSDDTDISEPEESTEINSEPITAQETDKIPDLQPVQTPAAGTEPEPVVVPQPEPEPDPVVTQEPSKNTNASGKERRSNWDSGSYLGSEGSDKYHDYECRAAKNILPENEIWFSSEETAQAAGYSRCGICW